MKTDNIKFANWYEGLRPHEKRFFKKQTMLICEISAVTFHKWIKGDIDIKNMYKHIINKISGEDLFEIKNQSIIKMLRGQI